MRVTRLQVSNFLKLVAVDVSPEGDIITISGKNASGKTSLLNSIAAALGGAAALKGTPQPIRKGASEAYISVDLGEFTVERHFTKKGGDEYTTKVVVTSKDGARYNSPQQFLDERIGALSFDPLAFAQKSDREQREVLLSLVSLPFDPAEFDAQRRKVYDDRTLVGREVKALEGKLTGIGRPMGERAPVDVTDLLDQRRAEERALRRIEHIRQDLVDAEARLERARANLAAEEANYAEIKAAADTLPPEPDLAAIDDRIRTAGEHNRLVDVERAAAAAYEQLDAKKAEYESLSTKLEKGDEYKAHCLAQAEMPVEGLGFDSEGVTYQGVPFAQASAAEQLRVSMAMAMALNPEVRVILIRDASLLDASNLALIEELAGERDFQCWLEVVANDGAGVGVVIEDGEVLAPQPEVSPDAP